MKPIPLLRTLLALAAIALLGSACSPIKETITIETNGGHKKELEIEVPRKFSKRKDQYIKAYSELYMEWWNRGVAIVPAERSEYSFNVRLFDKSTLPRILDKDIISAVSAHFEENNLDRKIAIEGEDFRDEQKEIRYQAYLKSQEGKPPTPQRGFWPTFPGRKKEGESSE